MYKMRESSTDERLDDFAKHVDRRFDKVDAELHRVNDRLDALHRTLFQFAGGALATLIAGIAGLIATQL